MLMSLPSKTLVFIVSIMFTLSEITLRQIGIAMQKEIGLISNTVMLCILKVIVQYKILDALLLGPVGFHLRLHRDREL